MSILEHVQHVHTLVEDTQCFTCIDCGQVVYTTTYEHFTDDLQLVMLDSTPPAAAAKRGQSSSSSEAAKARAAAKSTAAGAAGGAAAAVPSPPHLPPVSLPSSTCFDRRSVLEQQLTAVDCFHPGAVSAAITMTDHLLARYPRHVAESSVRYSSVLAACLFYTSKVHHEPVDITEIMAVLHVSRKVICRAMKLVHLYGNVRNIHLDLHETVDMFARRIEEITDDQLNRIHDIIDTIGADAPLFMNARPSSIAAGLIYHVTHLDAVSAKIGVSISTVRKVSMQIRDALRSRVDARRLP
jgi:hypothetical protein